MNFDMTDKLCALIKGPCPGRIMTKTEEGCPYWQTITVNDQATGMPDNWTGCGILMQPYLLTGLTRMVSSQAESIQKAEHAVNNYSERVGKGLLGVMDLMKSHPALTEGGD